ncbi:MAG: hypothetical protein AAF629_35330, partial [Chloroflexota bacterium]
QLKDSVTLCKAGPPLQDERPETSPAFDLWLFAADGTLKVRAAEQVGMWSNPIWHQTGITFGQATNPLNSVLSRYRLIDIDWDGSNSTILFPLGEEAGVNLPEVVWANHPDTDQFLFINRNNIYLFSRNGVTPQQLTSDNQSSLPQWFVAPRITIPTPIVTETVQAISTTLSISPTGIITTGTITP